MTRTIPYILPFVLLLLASCGQGHEVLPSGGEAEAVGFSSQVMEPTDDGATRVAAAYNTDNGIPLNGSIGVYAYYHDNSSWADHFDAEEHTTDATPDFMLNQAAVNVSPGNNYAYSPLKYWPNESGDKVSFVAYFPHTNAGNSATTGITPHLTESDAALPSYDFTVQDAASEQVDFLVSPLVPDMQKQNERVHFRLYHATAKVYVSVVVNDDLRRQLAYYRINRLQLTNLHNSGTLRYTDGNTYGWTAQTGTHTYTFTPGEAQLLLPQTLDDAVMLEMDYSLTFYTDGTVYQYDGTGQAVAVDQYTYAITDASAQLNTVPVSAPITAWQPNHVYHYIIRLGARSISFTAQVVEWGDEISPIIDPLETQ